MNYFAHGRLYVDDPYFLAGTALPDWLSVADRRVRLRERDVRPHFDSPERVVSSIARGVAQHHADDAWFHTTRAFGELSWDFTRRIREVMSHDAGFRPSFLGHILVEILLDAVLIAEEPEVLEAYYAAVERLDAGLLEDAVNRMARRPTDRIRPLLPLFSRERFLSDYLDDAKLCLRLNQVMRRVRLSELPAEFQDLLPAARADVHRARDALLSPT